MLSYSQFINESTDHNKLYEVGKALGIPMFLRTKVDDMTYEIGDVLIVRNHNHNHEKVPVVEFLKQNNYKTGAYLKYYTPQSRKKKGFAISKVSPNEKYFVGGFGSFWRKSLTYNDKIILDSDSRIIAIIGLQKAKSGYPGDNFSRIFNDDNPNRWLVKNEDWNDIYFDTTTGFWDLNNRYAKSKLVTHKYNI